MCTLNIFPVELCVWLIAVNSFFNGTFWAMRSNIDLGLSHRTNVDTYIAGIYLGRQILSVLTPFLTGLGLVTLAHIDSHHALFWIYVCFGIPVLYATYKLKDVDIQDQEMSLNFQK